MPFYTFLISLLKLILKNIFVTALSFILILVFFNAFLYFDVKRAQNNSNPNGEKIQITTSFYPLYEFSRQVGGNLVEVKNITPAGSEPHDYEPTAGQIQDIYNSKLLVVNGAGLESWESKITAETKIRAVDSLKIAASFDILPPLSVQGSNSYEVPSDKDPHFWMNPVMAKKQVLIIASELQKLDPFNSFLYRDNANSYNQKLDKLDQKFKDKLSNCAIHTVVTSHNFLQYLGIEYHFDSIPISGISPDSEPSVHDLAVITELIKSKHIKYIFTETLISPKLPETLANETGAKTLVLNPLEGLTEDQINQGQDYISVMSDNLNNLAKAMECK